MKYNPLSPEVQQNPYPYYAYLRQHAPVYEVPGVGLWVVSRHEDALSIFRNPQGFSSTVYINAMVGEFNPFSPEAPAMIASDPPDHTRLRKLVNRAFTPRRIAGMEAHIVEVTNGLLEQAARKQTFDLVKDLAEPLPVTVIAEMLGVEAERRHDFRRWSDAIISASKGTGVTEEEREQIPQEIAAFRTYFRAAIEKCRQQPGDNLLSDLVRAEEENQTLTSEEVLSLAVLLLVGGNETTTNLIGNAVLALLEHHEQMAQVRADLSLVPNLVEEALRYDAPVQGSFRMTTQEVKVAGTTLPAGAVAMPLIGSANRDERKFPEADRFDLTRNAEGHLAFIIGIHYCLGAQLARLEAKAALAGLLRRFPHFVCQEHDVPRISSIIIRGPKTLPLTVG
jgi:cytochrome P450